MGERFLKAYKGVWSFQNLPMVSINQKKFKAGPSVTLGGFQNLTSPGAVCSSKFPNCGEATVISKHLW